MVSFSNINEAKEFFKNDLFASSNGIELDELSEKECLCSMEVGVRYFSFGLPTISAHHHRL